MPALSAPSAKIWILSSVRDFMAKLGCRIELPALRLGKDNSRGLGEALDDEFGLGVQLLHVAEVNEHRAHSGALAAVDVAPAVPNHPGTRQVEAEVTCSIEQHAGLRLAPRVGLGFIAPGRVADLDPLDLGHELTQPVVHRLDDGLRLGAPAHIGLIGGDDQGVSGVVQLTARGRHAGEEAEFVHVRGCKRIPVADDREVERAIPVHENGGTAARGTGGGWRNRGIHGLPVETLSHLVWFTLRSGWETKRCQMTAWNASLCGVMLPGLTVGTMTQASATFAV